MLDIIMCDDDPFIVGLVREKIIELIRRNRYQAQLSCSTTKSADVLEFIRKNAGAYLVFLDLDFGSGKLNGIDIAKNIRKSRENVKIVYLTNHREMAMQVLSSGVEPFGFIEKGTDLNKMQDKMAEYILMALQFFSVQEQQKDGRLDNDRAGRQSEKEISLPVGIDEFVTVECRQILYLEAEKAVSHGITYHTMDGSSITVRDTMEHCEKELGEQFLRIHRSYLVNRIYMTGLQHNMVRITNGEELPCSVRMRNEVKQCLKHGC